MVDVEEREVLGLLEVRQQSCPLVEQHDEPRECGNEDYDDVRPAAGHAKGASEIAAFICPTGSRARPHRRSSIPLMPGSQGYAVVSCHVERPLDDAVWDRYLKLIDRRPAGFRIASG